MKAKQAERVRAGDTVMYEKAPRRIIAVTREGLWAPYFELDEGDVISHVLVQTARAEANDGNALANKA
jgi:hypothetical protein